MQKEAVDRQKATRGRPPKEKPIDRILAEEPGQDVPVVEVSNNLTPEEQAIYRRVVADADDWRTITEEEAVDYSLSRDPFELPAPALKLKKNKEFAFRWVTRKSERMDELKNKPVPFKWWPVNSTQPVAGVFQPFVDPNNGCVSREDQMLVFKPYWMFEKDLAYKRTLSDNTDRSKSLEALNGEVRRGGRDSDVELMAGKRSGMENKQLRQEIKGSDIQFRGEEEADIDAGRSFPAASSDLIVDE